MRKQYLILSLLFSITVLNCFSQVKAKFGDITDEEVKSTSYDQDPEAPAAVLHEEKSTYFDYSSLSGIIVKHRYFIRIKILNDDGLEYADQIVDTYVSSSRSNSEDISGLSGNTYNWVNGKVEKSKLTKESIFEEKISENQLRTKFALPAVKPGSVIEFKYDLSSPRDFFLPDFIFQRSIPVKYSKYSLTIPEYYTFNFEIKGQERVQSKKEKVSGNFIIDSGRLDFTSDALTFEANNLPALKDEDYVWCVKDYLTKATFELRSFQIIGHVYKEFSNNWANVDKQLLEDASFGKQFNHKLFKTEFSTLLTPEMPETDKIRAIHNLVRSRIKWNEENTLTAENPKDALKKGIGTSGEINAVLISALREAGFDAYPVVMSLRNKGRLPITHPTIGDLNYFVVGVDIADKTFYMDASSRYGDLNVLPPACLSDCARSVKGNGFSNWINLSVITKGLEAISITAGFGPDGKLSGAWKHGASGEDGYMQRSNYDTNKTEQENIDKTEAAMNISITDFKLENFEKTNENATISFQFSKNDIMTGNEFIYFNPLISPLFTENPFKSEQRKLPVEFLYPTDKRINVNINIPEGYAVEELPKPQKINLNEKDASFSYLIKHDEVTNSLLLSARYTLNRVLYLNNEYEHLRDFFSIITSTNTAQIVLKKISK